MRRSANTYRIDPHSLRPVPASGSDFVGRVRELKQLRDWFSQPGQRVAFISGAFGSGKTALIREFTELSKSLFPAGVHFTYGGWPESPARFALRTMPKQHSRQALLVLDEAEALPVDARPEISAILAAQPNLSLLMAGTQPFSLPDIDQLNIRLGSLTEAEFKDLIAERLSGSDIVMAKKLWEKFNGSPLVAQLAGETLRQKLRSLSELAKSLNDFQRLGMLGPDGKPLPPESFLSKKIISDVKEVNDNLLELIRNDPKAIYSVTSRKFEEIVAEILMRQGYRVELTPASKDGGFDMYAARKESLGEFLYLIECKKYAANHKVGVQIVRALHGIVQQKQATAGVIATTSYFTRGAREFRQEVVHQMHLADYVELQNWLGNVLVPHKSKK